MYYAICTSAPANANLYVQNSPHVLNSVFQIIVASNLYKTVERTVTQGRRHSHRVFLFVSGNRNAFVLSLYFFFLHSSFHAARCSVYTCKLSSDAKLCAKKLALLHIPTENYGQKATKKKAENFER